MPAEEERPARIIKSYGAYDIDAPLEQFMEDQSMLLSDIWAGWRFNPEDDTATVHLTASAPAPLAQHPKVRVVRVQFSWQRLTAAHQTVVDRLNPMLAPGITPGTDLAEGWPFAGRIAMSDNIVDVTVQKRHEDKRHLIEAALADELAAGTVRVSYGTVEPVVRGSCTHPTSCYNPFRGGTQITGVGSSCTMGFVMKNPATGVRYHSTDDHCGAGPWSHAGRAIGTTIWTSGTGVNHDFKVVRQTNQGEPAPSNWVYRASKGTTVAITSRMGSTSGAEGVLVCFEGVTVSRCGNVSNVDATVNGLRGGFGGFKSSDTQMCQGDSGSPVFNNSTLKAYGLLLGFNGSWNSIGCSPAGVELLFTWIWRAEQASGYRVMLTPTTEGLGPGQRMPGGYALMDTNNRYNLQMQTDGNLVIYLNGVWQWQTYTNGNPGAFLVMQNDGNLVLYSATSRVLWVRPHANRINGSRLIMQTDGNLVIYGPSGSPGARWNRFCDC